LSRGDVVAVYLQEVNRPDLAAEVFADDWQSLAAIERELAKEPEKADLAETVRLKGQAVLAAEAQKPTATVQTLVAMADLMQRQGNLDEAITYYRRAIDGNYGSVESHLGLAQALARKGDVGPAKVEADICLRLKPDLKAAKELLSDLATPSLPATEPDQSPGVGHENP